MESLLKNLGLAGLTPEELAGHPLLQIPHLRAMFQDTLSVTMLQAGFKPNVIPARAEATLDLRLLPGRSAAEVMSEIRQSLPAGPFLWMCSKRLRPPARRWKTNFFTA